MSSNCDMRLLVEVNGKKYVYQVREHTTLPSFVSNIAEKYGINYEFSIEIYDNDFDTYVILDHLSQIVNKSKIKISRVGPPLDKNKDIDRCEPVDTISNASTESFSSVTALGDDSTSSIIHNEVEQESANIMWHLTYTLPKFPPTLETALAPTNEEMLTSTHKDMIVTLIYSDIAGPSQFYPKPAQYDVVVNMLLDKYPKLLKNIGRMSALNFWRSKLMNKFRNYRAKDGASNVFVMSRKLKRNVNVEDTENLNSGEKRQRLTFSLICGLENFLAAYDAGENKETSQEYKNALQVLSIEKSPDYSKVCDYMERTFALRREEIVHDHITGSELIKHYPFLNYKAQMILELRRLMGKKFISIKGFCDSLKDDFQAVQHMYYKQRKRKDHPSMDYLLQKYKESWGRQECVEMEPLEVPLAIYYIALMVRESGDNIVLPYEEAAENRPPVYISRVNDDNFILHVEDASVDQISSLSQALYLFIASFYIFNLKYQKGSTKTCEFLQRKVFKISDDQTTSSIVLSIISSLAEINAAISSKHKY